MENFNFCIPTQIFFGKGEVRQLSKLTAPYSKILLTYGGNSIKRNGIYDKVKAFLAEKTVYELSGITPNPRISEVRKGIELVKQHKIDAIVSVGGGSVLDCSKAIALGSCADMDAWEMILSRQYPDKALPVIAVATMAATGSETGSGAVISNPKTDEKRELDTRPCYPKAAILDPEFTFTVPKKQTAAGSADILSHLMESYFVKKSTMLMDNMVEGVMRTVVHFAPIALEHPDDYEARAELLWASELANNGSLCCGFEFQPWACHTMEHELSAFYDITHGIGLAIITPNWMKFALNEETAPRFARFARNVFAVTERDTIKAAKEGIAKLRQFYRTLDLPTVTPIDAKDIPVMAEDAVTKGMLAYSFIPLKKEDVETILKKCAE